MNPTPLRFVLATLFASSPFAALATAQSKELQPPVRIARAQGAAGNRAGAGTQGRQRRRPN